MSGNLNRRRHLDNRGLALAGAVLCLLGGVACSNRWVGTGVVIDKRYEEAQVTYRESCAPAVQGGQANCTQKPEERPERWTLTVRDDEGNDHVVRVRESTFRQCEVGHSYTISYGHCDGP